MWFCAIAFLLFFILACVSGPIIGLGFGIIATLFFCTGLLIENLEKLFKKYFQGTNNKNQ